MEKFSIGKPNPKYIHGKSNPKYSGQDSAISRIQLYLASKLSELEEFENFAVNNKFRKQKSVKMTPK